MEFNFGAREQISQDVTHKNAAGTYKAPSNFGLNHAFPDNRIDQREEIMREMEKAMIRKQIMAEEMMRKRALEAEVRMEIMIERQIALQTGNPFSYLPEASGSDSRFPVVDQSQIFKSLEERMSAFVEERIGRLTGSQPVAVAEPLPFQSRMEPTVKDTVFPLVIPDGNLGKKRNAIAPPEVGPTDLIFKKLKPSEEEWSCAICQVSATNEQQLSDHLSGRKHELALKSQKERTKFGIGLIPKEKTLMLEGKKDTSKKYEAEMEVDASEKKSTIPANRKPSTPRFKFWCEMCEVASVNKTHMDAHLAGKRHKENLEEIMKISRDAGDKALLEKVSPQIVPLEKITRVDSDSGENVQPENVLLEKDFPVNHSPKNVKNLESEKEILTKNKADMKVEDELKHKITDSTKPANKKRKATQFRFWCEICKFVTRTHKEAHKAGKIHKENLEQILKMSCDGGDKVPSEIVSPEKASVEGEQIMKVNNDAGDEVLLEVSPQTVPPEQITRASSDCGDYVPPENVLLKKDLLVNYSPKNVKKLESEKEIYEADMKVEDELIHKITENAEKVPAENALLRTVLHAGDKVLLENVSSENICQKQIIKVENDVGDEVPPINALSEKVLHAADNVKQEKISPENVTLEQVTIVNSDAEDKVFPENVLPVEVFPENVLPGEVSQENVEKPESKLFKDDKAFWCLICEKGCQNFSMWAVHAMGEKHMEKLNTITAKKITGTENVAARDKGLLNFFHGDDRN